MSRYLAQIKQHSFNAFKSSKVLLIIKETIWPRISDYRSFNDQENMDRYVNIVKKEDKHLVDFCRVIEDS